MTILQELIQYANYCLEDKHISEYEDYISCQKHKWACERFLNDIKKFQNDENFLYYWDEEEAQKIVTWFTYLRHSKGELANQPIILIAWQQFFICQIYGWRRKDNKRRRFKKSFIECARKQAKSQMEAGIALYELAYGSTRNEEVYEIACAGIKRKQSKVVFDEAKLMLKGSPLQSKFKVTRDYIRHIKTGSTMIPLSKEDGQKNDGGNMALFILDEYHQHPTDDFYTMASYGQSTKESLLMIITTAGTDLTYPCYTQEYKYCSEILNPDITTVENDSYFVDILELDKDDDIDDIRNWWKANPLRMTYKYGVNKIIEEYKIAKEIPEKMPSFMTKCLDIWVQAKENGYMDMAKWNACEVKSIPYELTGRDVYIGVDLSAKIDLTSVSMLFPILDKDTMKFVLFNHSFIPKKKLVERMRVDKQPYDSWAMQKYLDLIDCEIVDQKYVINYIIDECKKYNWKINTICVDPANAGLFMTEMSDMGYNVVEVWQSQKSLNDATAGFREQVYLKNVLYTKNPLLTYAMSNARIKPLNGLIKIDKDATKQRIDPVDATLCAYKLAMFHKETVDVDEYFKSNKFSF